MSRVLARFKRGQDRVKLVPDSDPNYYGIVTIPADGRPSIEHKLKRYYPFVVDLYELHGYRRLVLCGACGGEGILGGLERCEACHGEGGHELS